jgi:hypothetical protein
MARMEGQTDAKPAKEQHKSDTDDARVWNEARPWPVRALTVLLALQGALVLALALWQIDEWTTILNQWAEPEVAFFLPLPFLGILGFIAALGFLWLRPGAWVVAMLVQGLHLGVTLAFYFFFGQRSFYLFVMMFFALVMVVYLNYAEVPAVFRVAPGEEAAGD